ncbi:MAG: GIY-YIG nuclease family protein [Bacteroidota bacterium]|nr:GIY-YIG nuclease family protein [Bacteroidota bacterium]
MFYTYVLKSLFDNSYYYGYTSDIEKRLKYHNSGKSKYTKRKRPWELHYIEEYNSKTEAIKREAFFKSIPGYNWLKEKNII